MVENRSIVEGRYLYCAINSNNKVDFGHMGIEGSLVYTVPYNDVGIVVHSCEAKPYKTTDTEKAKEWVLAHQFIVDCATKTFGTVIPFTFDTIFMGNDETIKNWLSEKHHPLKNLLTKLKDRDEYGVQIFLEKGSIEKEVESDDEIQNLKKHVESAPRGMAYLLEKRVGLKANDKKKMLVARYTKIFFDQIKGVVDYAMILHRNRGIPEKWKDNEIILNLACLLHRERVQELGSLLEKINTKEKFAVRFSGPWPPYSFVKKLGGT